MEVAIISMLIDQLLRRRRVFIKSSLRIGEVTIIMIVLIAVLAMSALWYQLH